jgi:hypothetical protein
VLNGVYAECYCYFDLGKGRRQALAGCLGETNSLLARRSRQLAVWRQSGGSLNYYVSLYGGSGVVAQVFMPDLLADIGRLGVELGLEIFAAEPEASPGARPGSSERRR